MDNLTPNIQSPGPFHQRFLIGIFHLALLGLAYWLLGFVVQDIGNLPGPKYSDIEAERLDQRLLEKQISLQETVANTQRDLEQQQRRQQLLRDRTENSQRTMNQLLDFQRLRLEKASPLSAEEQSAMADAQSTFLENQRQYQERGELVAEQSDQLALRQNELRQVERQLEEARKPIASEFSSLLEQHNWRIAMWKLGLLVPLLIGTVVLYRRRRAMTYGSIFLVAAIAVALKTLSVMHDHFPSRYFKYIFIGTLIVVVGRTLMYLLRARVQPTAVALLKRYKEAYECFQCPNCAFPMRRGPWKYLAWTQRSVHRLIPPSTTIDGQTDEAYTCPVCRTQLYSRCSHCEQTRPSLLPACPHCGNSDD